MDFDDIDFNKCDSLINEIEEEEKNHELLIKQLKSYHNQFRVNDILNNPNFTQERLFQVRVKVFRTFDDLLLILPDRVTREDMSARALRNPTPDSNIFLIEVFVSHAFHNKLRSKEWIVDFSIAAGGHKIARSVTLPIQAANSISAVLAFPRRRANDEIVKVFLTSPSNWRRIKLASIQTDISWKFTTKDNTHCKSKTTASIENAIEKINQVAAECDGRWKESPTRGLLSYKLHCELDGESFIAAVLRNSYVGVDPVQIVCNEGNRAAKIEINDQRVLLELDVGKKFLRIQAPGEELCQLKRYFTTVSASLNDTNGVKRKWLRGNFQHIQSVNVLKDVRTKLMEASDYNHIDFHNLLNIYDVYHRFVDNCPL